MAYLYDQPRDDGIVVKAAPPTVAERRDALASLVPSRAALVRRLPDAAVEVEPLPTLLARVRGAHALLEKADAAPSALESARWRRGADEVLLAPVRPVLASMSTAETAEYLRLVAKAEQTTDPTLRRGYTMRAQALAAGKEIPQ